MIVLKKLIVITFLLILSNSKAQLPENILDIVKKYPTNYTSIDALSYRIKNDFSNDKDKAAAAYTWIALNVSYDLKKYFSLKPSKMVFYYSEDEYKKIKKQHHIDLAAATFKNKRGICEGYTSLYNILCSKLGLVSTKVYGYTRHDVNNIGKQDVAKNHAWNSVYYEGQWHLIDVTWAAGKALSKNTWLSEFNNNYFDVSPEIFIKTHFPIDENWQLVDQPIEKNRFFSQPIYYSSIFENNILLSESHVGEILINSNTNKIFIHFEKYPKNTDMYYLLNNDSYQKKVKIEYTANGMAIGRIKCDKNDFGTLSLIKENEVIAQFALTNISSNK